MRFLPLILLLSSLASAQTCVSTTFFGNAKAGQPYNHAIGSGLTYRLAPFRATADDKKAPAEFIGWTIEVAYLKKKGEMEREFSWVFTPPYRQWNARQLNTSYSHTVADVLKADHTIYFPLDILDYAEADKMVTRILWRSSPAEVMEASRAVPKIPAGSAKLTILGQQLSGTDDNPSGIEMLSFKVDLIVPTSIKLDPTLKTKPATCAVTPLVPMLKEMVQ